MQELEKILEEIEQLVNMHYEDDSVKTIILRNLRDIRKHMNDGWIPVDRGLPEDDADVLITYADIDDDNYTDICITTYGYAYLGGNKLDYKEWRNPFRYFKNNYKVIAWRPLPDPYQPERRADNETDFYKCHPLLSCNYDTPADWVIPDFIPEESQDSKRLREREEFFEGTYEEQAQRKEDDVQEKYLSEWSRKHEKA